jgi:hypothetical protein
MKLLYLKVMYKSNTSEGSKCPFGPLLQKPIPRRFGVFSHYFEIEFELLYDHSDETHPHSLIIHVQSVPNFVAQYTQLTKTDN